MRMTSAPCAANVRPATGPAITRVRSSTRRPESGRSAPAGSSRAGASPILTISNSGRPATAFPCGCAAHASGDRSMVAIALVSAAAASNASASHFMRAACTASRS